MRKRRNKHVKNRPIQLSKGNPAAQSWHEILDKHNGGSVHTIFGTIILGGEK